MGEISRLKPRGAYIFAAALLESSDEEEGEECVSLITEKGEGLKERCPSDNDTSENSSEGRLASSADSPSLQVVSGEMTSCHHALITPHSNTTVDNAIVHSTVKNYVSDELYVSVYYSI